MWSLYERKENEEGEGANLFNYSGKKLEPLTFSNGKTAMAGTIGDIGTIIFSGIIGLIICIGILYLIKCGLKHLYEVFISKPETSLMTDFEMVSAPIGVMIIALTIIVAVIIIIMCISDIKIATCKLKNK